eukprot:TRINITY_DN4925_c0_g2_i1.p1 TRINITY_DN4925_c0_g2~~TRINITY_DN4925_c0_g2_i1.p1  ORF type:complete len:395 (+),score=36.31 TRINITY_DN4925_c0_g2_i1:57-1187(+)
MIAAAKTMSAAALYRSPAALWLLLTCAMPLSNALLTHGIAAPSSAQGKDRAALSQTEYPTLHLLFLIGDTLQFPDIWTAFFAGANAGKLRVWVHCSTGRERCMQTANLTVLPNVEVIETVHSQRIVDLMSPEVKLLENALAWRPERLSASRDKFVFLSGSTLPVKPLNTIYDSLVAETRSQMCFDYVRKWPQHEVNGSRLALAKTDQWVVLNRDHAAKLTQNWEYVNASDAWQWRFPMNGTMVESAGWKNSTHPAHRCTDEFAVFANLVGPVDVSSGDDPDYTQHNIENKCLTFVAFSWRRNHDPRFGREGLFKAFDVDPNMSCDKDVEERHGHPITFNGMGSVSMHALRASSYLFTRKFTDDAKLDGYAEIMFGT